MYTLIKILLPDLLTILSLHNSEGHDDLDESTEKPMTSRWQSTTRSKKKDDVSADKYSSTDPSDSPSPRSEDSDDDSN